MKEIAIALKKMTSVWETFYEQVVAFLPMACLGLNSKELS